ncbi:glycoside hydrolase family 20 protein [Flavobacterium humidisoli]|uniref:beta-N-acetylhexosaminidase n=1 Tax=Flavobacterium humidisoli TaxID=2937442 RepID=A0ABY4M1M3_9FLAO|nr:glycoside hydrolase family 20 protein [Flavobacterium humidisoli]UPZ17911.1 glycoside hydrolase family 20 protein [Flavobacterium humidisoli]
MKKIILVALVIFSAFASAQQSVSIVPKPVRVKMKNSSFIIDNSVAVKFDQKDQQMGQIAVFFKDCIKRVTGFELNEHKGKAKEIVFSIEKINGIGDEGYLISVDPERILLKANTSKGLFYAVQSLLQTLPFVGTNDLAQIPCMEIEDYPRFQWRGMMLDVSHHFFSMEMIKEFIDLLAAYKMNVFHWHLADGAGWRLEIKKYPKLAQQAAWRVDDLDRPWNWAEVEFNADRSKSTYGGYYTQEQAKEVVAYAKARNITVIPEIEMPGHSEAALAAYPEFSCNSKNNFTQSGNFYASKVESNICAGNEGAYTFLQDVLSEVLAIFPSKYIHIGGDEVDKTSWQRCAKCQAKIKKEKLKNEQELQSYFMYKMEKFLVSKNRKMIGWDEILAGGLLSPEATVMSWRGEAGGIEAVKKGNDVIMSPGFPCYFDHYQGDPETEPAAIGGFNTLKKVYSYEPVPNELSAEESKHVLGAQANLWTEYIASAEQVEYMILPRILALSEVLWSVKGQRDWEGFTERLKGHMTGFQQKGLHYSKGNFTVDLKAITEDDKLFIALEAEHPEAAIYYTTDGSMPSSSSNRYDKPFEASHSMTIKTIMVIKGQVMNKKTAEQSFTFNKATGKAVAYDNAFSCAYPANGANTLTDGRRGTQNIDKHWHGFNGNDLVATIDLEKSTCVSTISLGFFQDWRQWIFLPQWVKFEVSQDGINFKEVKTVLNTIPPSDKASQIKDFTAKFAQHNVKAVRITAKNLEKCPSGHPGEKESAWLFADEILIE